MAEKKYIEVEAVINEQKRFCGYLDKATRIEKCNTCAYFDPRAYHCSKYLREVETAVYLCPNCGADMREKS